MRVFIIEFPTLMLLLLLSLTLALAQQKQSSQPQSLAFTHLTVIDVAAKDSRRALKADQTVVVMGDGIAAVGAKVRLPEGAQVIDASSKYLIPGLWDMHIHSFTDNGDAWLSLCLSPTA